jgi:hypothetical protein
MNVLLWVAIGLGVGWAALWTLLAWQARRQSTLEKKLDNLESTD